MVFVLEGLGLLLLFAAIVLNAKLPEGRPDERPTLAVMSRFDFPDELRVPGATLGLRDVAAAEGTVWFAADTGLFVYRLADGVFTRVDEVDCAISAVATTSDGQIAWFGLTQHGGIGTSRGAKLCSDSIGYYDLVNQTAELFTPTDTGNEALPLENVVAIAVDSDGTVWLGDTGLGLVRVSDKTGVLYSSFSDSGRESIRRLVIGQDDTIWVTDGSALYRYQNKVWHEVSTPDIGGDNRVNDLLLDGLGRLWIAHDRGAAMLTLGPDDQPETISCSEPELPAGRALAVATDGRVIYLVTERGYARVTVDEKMAGCSTWEVALGDPAVSAQNLVNSGNFFEAAVSATASNRVTAWFLARAANEVYYVHDLVSREESQ